MQMLVLVLMQTQSQSFHLLRAAEDRRRVGALQQLL
jgi:hypothetical protein